MKIRRIVGKLVPGIIGVLAGLGWACVSKMPVQLTAYPPESLTKHWYAISAYLAILFGLPSLTMLVAFRKRLSREIMLLTILNYGLGISDLVFYFLRPIRPSRIDAD